MEISNKNQRGTFLETSPALKNEKNSFRSPLLALLNKVSTVYNMVRKISKCLDFINLSK